MSLSLLLLLLPPLLCSAVIKIDPATNAFKDELNRETFFRGVNAVYKLAPYHPDTGEYDPQFSMNAQDAEQLASWGFNVVRLGVLWSGLEPETQGVYNMTYLDEIAKIVDTLAVHNIYTILDMHQDVLARDFCGNGIPSWAAQMASNTSRHFPSPAHFPFELDENHLPSIETCLENDFVTYYFSDSVSKAFQSLYDNDYGLLDSFKDFWRTVAKQFKHHQHVLGYEIINEPWAGDIWSSPSQIFTAESKLLTPFYQQVHAAIREIDDQHIVFYEPLTYDLWPIGWDENPLGAEYNDRSVLSYHIYCPLAGGDTTPIVLKLVCQGLDLDFFHQRSIDVKRLGGGGMMTEWGSLSDTDMDLEEINHIMRLADDHKVSHIYWQYKDYNDITATGGAGISLLPDGEPQWDKIKILSRPFAHAVAGFVERSKFHENIELYELVYYPAIDDNFEARRTKIKISRETWYNEDHVHGIHVEVNLVGAAVEGDGAGYKVWCEDEGRRVIVEHDRGLSAARDVNVTIGVSVRPCLIKANCLC